MKRIFSKFLTLLLCFQILTVQNLAFAESGGGEDTTITVPAEPTPIESDAAGYNAGEQSYSRANDINYNDLVSMLTNMIAVSDGSATAVVCGSTVTSDYLAHAIGAMAYTAMAIVSNFQMKSANKNATQETVSLMGASVGDTGALDTLKTMRDVEKERKKALITKSIGLGAFTAALIIAEILAVTAYIQELTYQTNISVLAAGLPYTAAAQAAFIGLLFQHLGLIGLEVGCTGSSSPIVIAMATGIISSLMGGTTSDEGGQLLNTIMPMLPALFSAMGVTKSLVTPSSYMTKIIFHGVVLVISGTGLGITIGKVSKTQENIDDVDKIIADYNAQTSDPENEIVTEIPSSDSSSHPTAAAPSSELNPDRDLDTSLADNPTLKELRTKLKVRSIGPESYKGVDSPTLSSSITALNNIQRGLKNGSIAQVRASSELLGRNIGKLKKIRNSLREKLNKKRKKAGKKAIDFEARSNRIAKQLHEKNKKQVQAAFAKNPAAAKELAGQKAKPSTEPKIAIGTSQAVAVAPSVGGAKKNEDFLDDDLFSEDLDEQLDQAEELSQKQDSLDNYELAKNDIYKGSSRSIFKVLSFRYFKTAYPKLLEEKK